MLWCSLEQNQDNRALNDLGDGADFLRKSALEQFALGYTYPDFARALPDMRQSILFPEV